MKVTKTRRRAVGVALFGCSLLHPGVLPQPAAAQQPAPPPAPSPAPVPAEAGPALTLDEAVAYAQKNNPRVAEAAALVREAQARITQRRAVRGPQASINNFVFRQGPVVPSFTPGENDAVPAFRWNLGLEVSQILLDFGQRALRQSVATREAQAAQFALAETQNDVRFVVATAFFNVLRGQGLLDVAQERRNSAAEQLRVARARFESDVSPRFDVIRAEAELANAEQDVIVAQNEVDLAEAALNTAMGRDVTTPVRLSPETGNPPAADVPFEAAREAALRNRPRIESIRRTIAAGQQEVRARRRENWPQVGLAGGYNRPNPGGFASTEHRYEVGLVMTFPFFDNGLTKGRVREAQAAVDADRQVLEQARQQVDLEIRQAQLQITEALQRVRTAEQEQRSAREALRVAEVRYRAGVGTNIEVTDAQVAVARGGQNLANARFDYETAVARLEFATGVPVETLTAAPGAPASPGTPAPAAPAPAPNAAGPKTE